MHKDVLVELGAASLTTKPVRLRAAPHASCRGDMSVMMLRQKIIVHESEPQMWPDVDAFALVAGRLLADLQADLPLQNL